MARDETFKTKRQIRKYVRKSGEHREQGSRQSYWLNKNTVNGRDRMKSRGTEVASMKKRVLRPMVHTYTLVWPMTSYRSYPRCICAYVLCNTPVHHVVSTLNTLSTSRQARPTTGNPCTYGTIAYLYHSVYSTPCVFSYDKRQTRNGREGENHSVKHLEK